MKKYVPVLLAGFTANLAIAQSSVTLFGVVDAAINRYSVDGGTTVTRLGSGGLAASRIGFRGLEDLGGGLAAGFWLESEFAADSGTGGTTNTNNQATGTTPANQGLTFNRRSTVSLLGPWGELRLGRDYVPTFWNFAVFDPFAMQGAASASNLLFAGTSGPSVNVVRNSNSIQYLYNAPHPAGAQGLYGQLQYALGENPSGTATASDGKYYGFRAGYATGPFNGAIAYSKTNNLANKDFTLTNGGMSWNFGFATLMASYTVAQTGLPNSRNSSYLLGATIPLGVGYIPVSLIKTKRNNAAQANAEQLAIGYVHNLSKRTAVYTTYARVNNHNGAAFSVGGSAPIAGVANAKATGIDLGIRHSF
ncbi:porin [Variovorax terrae]|uniref:Porin n=1 Tax=Variovorax terrae TaxID=2923278 RepID=A0A9X2ANV3_9BURK|nr:porin [Variovorax terrae]MCJ0765213.1 porin [Variovorax terrae]